MRKDRSLEEIDIVKLLFYALVFAICCIIMIFGFIVPSIKEYKNAKIINNDKIINLNKIEQVYNSQLANLTSLKDKNIRPLEAIVSHFNEMKFVTGAGKYFSNVKLNKLPQLDKNEHFLRYELNVTGLIKSPQNFYSFIDFINEYENIIRVDFPISMKGNGDKIDTSFKIKVYVSQKET
ncbi:hypothetical protein ACLH6Q_000292 [Campylobacter fetus]|uniref:hypothetical protein n=1 Tax=Campylobacter fetus TaxID=196 RepID=UPI000818C449|nr:hypothetical protein [Campylobacter fetus]EAH8300266.1 hypothetical protein [Campylobacter fetus]EAI5646723.1 hypothetical protein [Campylobacter fetus]EAI5945017.1 hypothetical protein [Campylobacter fetus]EAI7232732.1 hypothetical protein [Campylobacter fetus]EAJ0319666.1 hypothetical protein [Campylobacter fetus]